LASDPCDLVTVILPGDRGNNAVREQFTDALRRISVGGRALVTGDKDRGFDRYFKEAITLFGTGEILERSKGLRVGRLEKTNPDASLPLPSPEVFDVTARGKTLRCAAFPGTFSSGKLDAASRLLLEHLPNGSGRNVLDIGAGYGALSGFLALEGATVCMLEDDGPSVRSCHETLALNTLEARVVHSDVDAKLEPTETFDLIVTNPPFHVGSDLILDVALEFIRCAERRLEVGGEFWLVANHFLSYEREMARIGTVREVVREKGFKVLSVRRGE
jgi:16S rRNA (guanine1207-N2)-methyltransferase